MVCFFVSMMKVMQGKNMWLPNAQCNKKSIIPRGTLTRVICFWEYKSYGLSCLWRCFCYLDTCRRRKEKLDTGNWMYHKTEPSRYVHPLQQQTQVLRNAPLGNFICADTYANHLRKPQWYSNARGQQLTGPLLHMCHRCANPAHLDFDLTRT